ncbi:MAG: hypothetical protein M1829_000227 [Trizodia sp. TS-e1964]|nr:MAG: hypothetical protein M1829_000227 [Trizodia sp. TS-e1964]
MESPGSALKTPVYFVGHGGPNTVDDFSHPVQEQYRRVGNVITHEVRPRAVVVISAHWQARGSTDKQIEVNTAEHTDLIYDFGGFPARYYREEYPHTGSKVVAQAVLDLLKNAGFDAKGVSRGLDHGVWVCFKCAFPPASNALSVPIIQLSLLSTASPSAHYALGRALAPLRSQNILIVASGMAVHNLRLLSVERLRDPPFSFALAFDAALKKAVEAPVSEREEMMCDLLARDDARLAHPTVEHLLPLYVAAGAADGEKGERLWTLCELSFSWAMFRFGEVSIES